MSKGVTLTANAEDIYPVPYYAVGDIYLSSSSSNPANKLGYGSWELIDKEFESAPTERDAFTSNSNTTSFASYVNRSGHDITITCAIISATDVTDSTVTFGTFAFDKLGITEIPINIYFIGSADGGNTLLMLGIDPDDGSLYSGDVINANHTVWPAGNAFRFTVTFTNYYGNMLNSACNKFYWERTA